jgi:hypothetical protein
MGVNGTEDESDDHADDRKRNADHEECQSVTTPVQDLLNE